MANLIQQYQVQGLVALQALVNQINTSYPALKVTTSVVQTEESAPGANDAVNYTAEALLEELKTNVDGILDGGDGLSLPELARRISQLNAELNGGTYEANEVGGDEVTLLGFKNKSINDVVRVSFNITSGTTATPVDASLITENITSGQSLTAYTASGAPIVKVDGTANAFDFDSKTFAGAPYILDIDASRASGDSSSATGGGELVYSAFTGNFKVFPVGTWTLETLPATALLDNNEMQLIAYDQALNKVILNLAKDKALIDRIVEAVGDTAIAEAVASATQTIDARLDKLEGTTDSDLTKVAVKVSQITGKPVGDTAAETVTKTTAIASKAYVDDVDNAIKADIGDSTDATAYDSNGRVSPSTVRGELNSIEAKMMYKDALVTSVKTSVTQTDNSDPDNPIVTQATDDQNTINETALVTKFVDIDSKAASLKNSFETFRDTTAHEIYVENSQITDTFTKITAVSGVYTDSYTDTDNKEVIGKKVFNEEISKLQDSVAAGTDAAYLRAGIVVASAVTADATKGITAKTAEDAANIDANNKPIATIPVYSKKAVDNKVDTAVEEINDTITKLDNKTYDWGNIVADDGLAIQGTVTKTTFNASTGAVADASSTEVLVAADTAETKSELTTVDSSQVVNKKISALKAELEAEEAADKLELKNRITHGDAVQARALAAEVARLTAASGTTLAAASLGQEAIVADADGVVKQLQDSRVLWSNIQTSAGISTAIMDTTTQIQGTVAAEAAASLNTKVASKQYVDDAVKVAAANATVAVNAANRAMDDRVDALEAVVREIETATVTSTGSNPAVETITLSHTPSATGNLVVVVNGINYYLSEGAFTISGAVITWDSTAAGFTLAQAQADTVKVHYTWSDTSKISHIA